MGRLRLARTTTRWRRSMRIATIWRNARFMRAGQGTMPCTTIGRLNMACGQTCPTFSTPISPRPRPSVRALPLLFGAAPMYGADVRPLLRRHARVHAPRLTREHVAGAGARARPCTRGRMGAHASVRASGPRALSVTIFPRARSTFFSGACNMSVQVDSRVRVSGQLRARS